jgi:hypothetical protein
MTGKALARSASVAKDTRPQRREPGAKCGCAQRTAALAGPCSDCRRKRLVGVQAQLALGTSGDRYEREADHIADRIARGGRVTHSRERNLTPLQAHAVRGVPVPAETIEAALAAPGQALDRPTRAFYESRLAHDFSNVRVHAGPAAAAAAKSLDARAFTLGRHVFFAEGQYRPDAPQGRRLLAHELAHVVQQSAPGAVGATPAWPAPVQRQSWLDSLQSRAASLVPDSVWSVLDVDPAAAMAPSPADAIALLKRLRDAPVLGPMLMRALTTSEGVEDLLGLDARTLDRIFAVLADPEPHLESLRAQLQPLVARVPAYAAAEAEARLGWLREHGEPFARVMDAMASQLAQLPAQWWPLAVEILRSQFMLWDWSAESAALTDATAKRAAGEFDNDYEYWLHVAQTLADGLDRILGAVGMAAVVVGLAGGGTLGGAAGATGAGLVGGAVTLGTGAAPSAALGGTGGGGAGSGVGGGLGGLVYELLGGVSLVGSVGTEVGLLGDAVKDLSLEEQGAKREQADYEQIAASLIGLGMMVAFAVLGSIGVRIARKTKGALLGAARKAASRIEAPAVPEGAIDVAASLPAVKRSASHDLTEAHVAEAARASPVEIESSVARSSQLESDRLAPEQIAKEVAYVDRHPELVEGEPPHRRAEVGEHEIVEQPGGGCARHSAPPAVAVACPVSFANVAVGHGAFTVIKDGDHIIVRDAGTEAVSPADPAGKGSAGTARNAPPTGPSTLGPVLENALRVLDSLAPGDTIHELSISHLHPDHVNMVGALAERRRIERIVVNEFQIAAHRIEFDALLDSLRRGVGGEGTEIVVLYADAGALKKREPHPIGALEKGSLAKVSGQPGPVRSGVPLRSPDPAKGAALRATAHVLPGFRNVPGKADPHDVVDTYSTLFVDEFPGFRLVHMPDVRSADIASIAAHDELHATLGAADAPDTIWLLGHHLLGGFLNQTRPGELLGFFDQMMGYARPRAEGGRARDTISTSLATHAERGTPEVDASTAYLFRSAGFEVAPSHGTHSAQFVAGTDERPTFPPLSGPFPAGTPLRRSRETLETLVGLRAHPEQADLVKALRELYVSTVRGVLPRGVTVGPEGALLRSDGRPAANLADLIDAHPNERIRAAAERLAKDITWLEKMLALPPEKWQTHFAAIKKAIRHASATRRSRRAKWEQERTRMWSKLERAGR